MTIEIGLIGPDQHLAVIEAVAASPQATALLWRYLCDIDLVRTISAPCLPPTHPLLHLVTEPRRLHMTLEDAVWVRLVDVGAALSARAWYSSAAVTFALDDTFCPWNTGVYRLDGAAGQARRTDTAPDLRLDAAALGALYLGSVSLRQLADAGDVVELQGGAIERADALFHCNSAPWCPEIF